MKSGKPGGTMRARGAIRVTGSPGSSGSCRMRYATDCWKPVNGVSVRVMSCSHFTCAMPYQPGTTSRTGWPCCGGRGAPFMAYATRTSGSSAVAAATVSERW